MRSATFLKAGPGQIYADQFVNLHESVRALFAEVAAGQISAEGDLGLLERVHALQRLAHRLGEEAGRGDLEGFKRTGNSDRMLLLVVQGVAGLDFVFEGLAGYLDTRERVFLTLASHGDKLLNEVRRAM